MNGAKMMKAITSTKQKQFIQEVLLLLADFYKYPSEVLFNAWQSGALEQELNNLLANISSNHSKIVLGKEFSSFTQMKDVYRRCFLGPSEPVAPPIESLYKEWTTDPTAETPIARQKGYLYGDSAIHLKYLYEQYEIEIPKEFENMPDHLTLLLEFLALLIQYNQPDLIQQYINDHFDWIESFKQKLIEVDGSEPYVFITDLVGEIVFSYCNNLQKS